MGKRLTFVLAIFALLVVPPGIYTAGYLLLCEQTEWPDYHGTTTTIGRTYPQRWLAHIYQPAGKAEQWLRGPGIEVEITWSETPGPQIMETLP